MRPAQAFLAPLPVSTRAQTLGRSATSPRRRTRKRPRFHAMASPQFPASRDDDVPDDIRALDMLEYQRRESLAPPQSHLTPEAKDALFEQFPSLAALDATLDHAMAQPDYDPSDHRVYSWAYRQLRPWAPSRIVQLLIPAVIAFAVTRLLSYVRHRFHPSAIAAVLVVADKYFALILAAAVPALLFAWAIYSARSDRAVKTDGLRRCTVMFTASAPLLLAAWMISASGNLTLGLAAGLLVRTHLAASLWLWGDLRREIFLSSSPIAPFFRVWRWLTTALVIIAGSAIRLLPLFAPRQLPLRSEFLFRANRVRSMLGTRFRVAFSLCNDTRGLFLLGSILCVATVLYGLYLFIFVTDFFRNIYHRRCETPMTSLMVQCSLYQPNVHPDETLSALSSSDTYESFIPSAPMMLRNDNTIVTQGILADEGIMPVIAYLDKEDEILRHDGGTVWLQPRTEQVPITKDLSREKRSLDAMFAWSRPLEKEDAGKSFVDFFETLEDDEYVYDPVSGNWVFENAGVLGEHTFESDDAQSDGTGKGSGATAPDVEAGEGILQIQTSEEGTQFEVSAELEPWARRFIEDEMRRDDDSDDPSVSVYV